MPLACEEEVGAGVSEGYEFAVGIDVSSGFESISTSGYVSIEACLLLWGSSQVYSLCIR